MQSRLLLLTIDFDMYTDITLSRSMALNRGKPPQGAVNKFPGERETLCSLQHGTFD